MMRGGGGVAWNQKLVALDVIPDEWILVVALIEVVAVVHPLLLNELELLRDTRVEGNEDQAVFSAVVAECIRRSVGTVRNASANDAPAVHQLPAETERVSRIRAPDMRPHGAARALRIGRVDEARV